ncbi:MAG: lipoate--protein ligase family protein [Spirochaetota bacterium]
MPGLKIRPFRFIFTGENDGPTNMAMDEAVFRGLIDKGDSTPMLRVYRWHPPTISIGYFQSMGDIDYHKCIRDGIGIVRRLTGGRAVLHSNELTYSILFTSDDFSPFNKREIFLFIASCLVDALGNLGIKSRIVQKTRGNLKTANCFASPAQYEIEALEAGKLIGSAQVIKDGVILQHGAIPLTDSYMDIVEYLRSSGDFSKNFRKNSTSLNQVSGTRIGEIELLEALRKGFGKHIDFIEGSFTEMENLAIKELAEQKYSKDWWNFRRK